MLIGIQQQRTWARIAIFALVLLFAVSPWLSHLVLPHAQMRHAAAHAQNAGHDHHQNELLTTVAAFSASEQESSSVCGQRLGSFCADCSLYCHSVFDVVAQTSIEIEQAPDPLRPAHLIPDGMTPDVLPRPPQVG